MDAYFDGSTPHIKVITEYPPGCPVPLKFHYVLFYLSSVWVQSILVSLNCWLAVKDWPTCKFMYHEFVCPPFSMVRQCIDYEDVNKSRWNAVFHHSGRSFIIGTHRIDVRYIWHSCLLNSFVIFRMTYGSLLVQWSFILTDRRTLISRTLSQYSCLIMRSVIVDLKNRYRQWSRIKWLIYSCLLLCPSSTIRFPSHQLLRPSIPWSRCPGTQPFIVFNKGTIQSHSRHKGAQGFNIACTRVNQRLNL